MDKNTHLFESAKPAIVPDYVERLSKREKREIKEREERAKDNASKVALEKERLLQMQTTIKASRDAGYNSLLISQVGNNPRVVAEIVQEVSNVTQEQAREMIGKLPCLVVSGVEREEVMRIADLLVSGGTRVEIK